MNWPSFLPSSSWIAILAALATSCAPASENTGPDPRGAAGPWSSGDATPRVASVHAASTSSRPEAPPKSKRAGPVHLEAIDLAPPVHPLDRVDEGTLANLVRAGGADLGSASLGKPNRGWLFNAVAMPEGPLWHIEEPPNAWGTRETIESIQRAIERVESDHPGSFPLHIGHISRRTGGWLRPHRSHQSGRDVDLGYYYLEGPRWYAAATAENLDRERTWSLLMGLLTQGNVEYVFITRDVQALLLEHARAIGHDDAWLAELFDSAAPPPDASSAGAQGQPAGRQGHGSVTTSRRVQLPSAAPEPIVRHRWGHHTHLHVRFYSDDACRTGQRTFHLLRKQGKI